MHAAADDAVPLKLPAAHAVTLDPAPVYPASAVQSFSRLDTAGLLLLEGHVEQATDDALSSLYVPESHPVTLLPLPVCPASAKQPLSAAVPVALPVPELDGQLSHDAATASVLYLPASQSEQAAPA